MKQIIGTGGYKEIAAGRTRAPPVNADNGISDIILRDGFGKLATLGMLRSPKYSLVFSTLNCLPHMVWQEKVPSQAHPMRPIQSN